MKEGALELLEPRKITVNDIFLHTWPADKKGFAIKLSKLFYICHHHRKIKVLKSCDSIGVTTLGLAQEGQADESWLVSDLLQS